MKRKSRKLVSCFAATVLCLTMLFGVTVQAGSMNPNDYFYVSVGKEISATSVGQSIATRGFGGTITDWGQAISTGGTASATLSRIASAGSSYSYPGIISYKWDLVNKDGTKTTTLNGKYVSIPSEYAGGYVIVTIKTRSDSTWSSVDVSSYVTIS